MLPMMENSVSIMFLFVNCIIVVSKYWKLHYYVLFFNFFIKNCNNNAKCFPIILQWNFLVKCNIVAFHTMSHNFLHISQQEILVVLPVVFLSCFLDQKLHFLLSVCCFQWLVAEFWSVPLSFSMLKCSLKKQFLVVFLDHPFFFFSFFLNFHFSHN